MRLLLSALPLLLVATSLLGEPTAPTPEEPQTTIEIITENVTRTVIHEVTDPTVARDVSEAEAYQLAETNKRIEEIQKQLEDAKHVIATLNNKTITAETDAAAPAVGNDAVATNATTTVCSFDQFAECRKESNAELDTCMTTCSEEIKSYGDKTTDYLKCFSKFNASIIEAETCLFKNKTDYATNSTETIDSSNWDELTNITYSSVADKVIDNAIWKKHEPKYAKIQTFFTCTKNCMHKKLGTCAAAKGCALKASAQKDFEETMKKCTKKNYKIVNAIFNTCYCLAWQNGVKELQGSCVYVGSQYYIDRA